MEELFAIIGLFTLPLSIGFAVAWWNARGESPHVITPH